jgi:glycosyltransferase involved in cell wall biosynthesis
MNILFFPGGAYVGGMEVVVHSLMTRLNAIGHRSVAIVSGWNDGDYPSRLRASGIECHEVRLGRFYLSKPQWTLQTLGNMLPAIRDIRHIAADLRPDRVIYVEAQTLLLGSWILPRARNVLYMHSSPDRFLTGFSAQTIARKVESVICVSSFIARRAERTPLKRAKISVVHNGIVEPSGDRSARSGRPVQLGIIGELTPRKHHLTLIQAVARLKERLPAGAFCLHVFGRTDSAYARLLQGEAARLGVQDLVHWAGFVKDRNAIYDILDIVVAASVDEPFGMTVLEAGAYGRAIVATRSGGFPEIVRENETGLLCEPGDAASLMQALETLIVDEKLRARLGLTAQAYIRSRFTLERVADAFVEALGDPA